jgi:hypothetical protein
LLCSKGAAVAQASVHRLLRTCSTFSNYCSQIVFDAHFERVHSVACPQVETTATCIRNLGSGDSGDVFAMGHVQIISNVRGARGHTAASAYKFDVLLSWDINFHNPASSANMAMACSADKNLTSDVNHSAVRGKQVEVSNGLLLHEVISEQLLADAAVEC